MWICLNNGFLSAVENRDDKSSLVVRARRKSHLEDNFPNSEIIFTDSSDYPWRILISKLEFADKLYQLANNISYPNFKRSVEDNRLQTFYDQIWWRGLYIQDVKTKLTDYYKKAFRRF